MGEKDREEKIQYFHVYKKLEGGGKRELGTSGLILKINKETGKYTNWTGNQNFLKQAGFYRKRDGSFAVGPDYEIEPIEKAKALYLAADNDKSGGVWDWISSRLGSLTSPLIGHKMRGEN